MKLLLLCTALAFGMLACSSTDDAGDADKGDELSEENQRCSFEGVCKRCKTMEMLKACASDFENNECETVEESFCTK